MCKVAIIGAGVAGLSAAHFLKGRYEVIIFEKEGTPGGLIKCCRVNGNLFHTCGGHVFNSKRQDVLDWFDEEIDFLNYGNPMQELRMAISKSEDVKRLMLQMIQEMDLDIVDFRVEEKENDRIEVFTKHVVDEYEAELNLFDESSGTKKLFGLLPFIAKSLLKGTTLVIDELDAKIHPVLLKYLIMTFSNMEKNKKGAQLIFTSHDLSTMNSEVFRRDEIWFVAKGNRQNSKLYSLVEFKNKKGESVRKDAKFDKQYLEGKYGADPYLRKIIDWGTVNG